MHGKPYIHNPPSHKHMCLQDLSTMMTGHGLTLPPSFVESQPCLLPSLVRCPSAFLEGVWDDSQTQLHQYNRQCLTAPETGWVSFLAYLRPVHVLFPPHRVHVAFLRVLFPCKGREACNHAKNHILFGNKSSSSLPQIHESGYSAIFLPEFLGEGYFIGLSLG